MLSWLWAKGGGAGEQIGMAQRASTVEAKLARDKQEKATY
jgi:hypothetical protein